MKLKKLFHVVVMVMVLSMAFSQIAMAKSKDSEQEKSKNVLVALGDSISYGYDLSPTNDHPSIFAFPSLIAQAGEVRLTNLSVPGHTSANLLALLKTPSYRDALSRASVITLDIGSNDFLQGAKPVLDKLFITPGFQPSPDDMLLIGGITQKFAVNLAAIIQDIRSVTKAPIVLYTIYNPFYGFDVQAGGMVAYANQIIASYDADPSIVVADAFSAFAGKQDKLILPKDVHPNVLGQFLLAKIGIQAIETLTQRERVDTNRYEKTGR